MNSTLDGDGGWFEGYAIEPEWRRLGFGEVSKKYLSLVRADPERPCPTIVGMGGVRGGAGVTHPFEPRKFTMEELRIICGFPADFVLTGTYTKQWERLGRAVPPPMMRAIAATLRDGLFTRLGRTRPGFTDAFTLESRASDLDKPAFHLPSMADVGRARGTNGLTVVSTFSGCGGSCLGFEMAGYRVLWANEFVEAARDTYAANHPETLLDGRDIRKVDPRDILDAIGLERGELDVLNGSPPCASFSSAGKRSEGWGKVKAYSDTQQRTDDLFFEFVRLLEGLQPRAFVAENVAGLTRGVAIGYFKDIMRALDGAGYDVKCSLLDAQWLGVPQSRKRAIFIGTRKDLRERPEYPKPQPHNYTLREVLPGLARIVHDTGGQFSSGDVTNQPSPTVGAKGGHAAMAFKVIDRVVHDTSGLFGAGDITDKPAPTITVGVNCVNRLHYKVFERDAPTPELPSCSRKEWDRLKPGEQSSKYFSLIRSSPDEPAPCIVANQGNTATHPSKPRKFSMEELRIICGFPHDFILTGSFAQQWERLGRAVPPPMMRAVAATLRDGLFTRLGRTQPGFFEAR